MKLIRELQQATRVTALPAVILMAAWLGVAFTAPAQQYEYEPDEGLHEEEWYDPSDWFDNDPGVDYETDWWDYGYPYDYDYVYDESDYGWHYDWDATDNEWDREYGYHEQDYNYDKSGSDYGDSEYGWHYDWNPVNDEWDSDYGYHQEQYVFDASGDYGWHYDWDPAELEWVEDYGFHTSNYDFDYSKYDYTGDDQGRANQQAKNRQERQRAQQKQQQQIPGQYVVRGQIDSFRRMDLRSREGQREQRQFVKIRLENGEQVAVDLGGPGSLQRLNLDRGERIVIRGRKGKVGDRQVVFANEITVKGRTFQIRSGEQAQEARSQRSGSGQQSARRTGMNR